MDELRITGYREAEVKRPMVIGEGTEDAIIEFDGVSDYFFDGSEIHISNINEGKPVSRFIQRAT